MLGAPGCFPLGRISLARGDQCVLVRSPLASCWIIDGSSRLELLQHGPAGACGGAQALGELLVLVVPNCPLFGSHPAGPRIIRFSAFKAATVRAVRTCPIAEPICRAMHATARRRR